MTDPIDKPLFDRICALLEEYPDHAPTVDYLRGRANGALVLFLPAEDDEDNPSGWQSILADLAEVHPLLEDAGIGILVVKPPFEGSLFPGGSGLPFPCVDFTAGDEDLSCVLWKSVRELVTCRFFEFAALLDRENARLRKEWRKQGPVGLVPAILAYLVDDDHLVYTPGIELVHLYERAHLARRRENAAAEGLPADPDQAAAYQALMTGGPDRPAVGMAFSGGGIRAATFTLGMTQALAKTRFLPWVDYFSSVSGGGFTASNLVSLLSRRSASGEYHFNTQWEHFPFNPEIEAFRAPGDLETLTSYSENRNFRDVSHQPGRNAQLTHLLKKANYLIPRLGLATRDLLRGLGALLPGMGFTLMLFLLAVAVAAGAHYFIAGLLAPAVLVEAVLPTGVGLADLLAYLFNAPIGGAYGPSSVYIDMFVSGAAAALFVYVFLVAQYSYPISRKKETADAEAETETAALEPRQGSDSARVPGRLRARFIFMLLVFLIAGGAAWFFGWRLTGAGAAVFPDLGLALSPAAGLIVSLPIALFALDSLLVLSLRIGRARAGVITLGAVFPHPRAMVPLFALYLLQVLAAFYLLRDLLGPSGLIFPVALATAGVLILLLTDQVMDQGIIGWPRWATAAILLSLTGLGAGLLLPQVADRVPLGCPDCLAWTLLPAAGLLFAVPGLAVYGHRAAIWGGFGLDRWERYDRFVLKMVLAFEVAALLLALVIARAKAGPDLAGFAFWIWQPAVFLVGMLAVFTLIRLVVTGRRETWGSTRFRTMIWAVIGMKSYVVIAAVVFALLAVPHMLAIEESGMAESGIPVATAILSGAWAFFLARFSGKETSGEGLLTRLLALPAGIRNFVLGALVIIFWLSLAFIAETLLDLFLPDPIRALGVGLVALGLLLLIGILLNYNFLSPHLFFGDRIVDVFLRTDYETEDGRVVVLRDETDYLLRSICQRTSSAPYHLVVSAINLAGSGHLQDRDRKSRHFIFSREFVGSNATGYVRTALYRGGSTKYGSTIALSGAAVSPGLGTFTFFAQSFMLTLLNVRLGQWWLNPKEYAGQILSETALQKMETYESKAFWPLYLLDEAFAKTTARRKLVNLTDGGHTRDNGGLYPLFERRCRLIIAGDASQDAAGLCPDLFSALHYARVDLGVEVEIDVSGLKPAGEGEKGRVPGMTESHLAVGRVRYPAAYRRDGSLKYPAEHGWLVYVKPAVSECMPPEVLQFWETDNEMFPHPTTADQFFSERQFEAQRRLGEESVTRSLQVLRDGYRTGAVRDPGGVKARFLREAMDRGRVDYALLQHRQGLLDVILRDLQRAVRRFAGEATPADA